MRNFVYLLLALLLFGAAGLAYWTITPEGTELSRSLGPTTQSYMAIVREWQPILSVVSSIGGLISFILQLRVWLRRD